MTHIEIRENEEVKFTPYLTKNKAPNIRARLATYSETIARDFGTDLRLGLPSGILDSHLALIYGNLPTYIHNSYREAENRSSLPFKLDSVGLTKEESIVWPLDFGATNKLQSNELGRSNPICKHLSPLSLELLKASAAKVVLASGKIVQDFVKENKDTLNLSGPLKMQIQGLSLSIWLEERFSLLRRVYVDIPEFEDVIYGCGWAPRNRISVELKFASRYSGLNSLNYSFYKNATIRDEIFKLLGADKEGLDVSLTPALHDWLHQEGFSSDEEIEELVIVSGG